MKLTWLALLSVYNSAVLAISLCALLATEHFCTHADDITLPLAPKATGELHKVFIPPMKNMQIFVFCFDLGVALYYLYQWPIWDSLKAKFPYFQYESKVVDKPDCSSLLLNILFVFLSKVSS